MLVAEIHGHVVKELAGNEDYLTSAIFGHLRYLRPAVFWEEFFSLAAGATGDDDLASFAARAGVRINECSDLSVRFWPSHPSHGTPDMALCFTGTGSRGFVLLIEVKLWSGKSGEGDHDQLCRYLKILDDLAPLDLGQPDPVRALLYLTPRESLVELMETARLYGDGKRLFRAQWQDVAAAAQESMGGALGTDRKILRDVAAFLRARGLEYFKGFARLPIESLPESCGHFYDTRAFPGFSFLPFEQVDEDAGAFYSGTGGFSGFTRHDGAEPFAILKGRWVG